MDNNVMFELADRLKNLRDKKKEIETSLKSVNDMIFEVESALAELMTLSETQNFTRSGTMFSLTTSNIVISTLSKSCGVPLSIIQYPM